MDNREAFTQNKTEVPQMAPNPRSFQYLDVYDKEIAELVMLRHIPTYRDEIVRRLRMVDALLKHCDKEGGECSVCGEIVCPFGNPLHFHHDGCPACHFADYVPSVEPKAT